MNTLSNLITIKAGQKTIALIVKADFKAKPHQFLTDKDNPLQLGVLAHKKDSEVKPHQHRKLTKTTHQNQEFIYLKSGKVEVTFYRDFYRGSTPVKKHILEPGDCLLQLSGGHGFKYLKDSETITIKQGPYFGKAKEKKLLKL